MVDSEVRQKFWPTATAAPSPGWGVGEMTRGIGVLFL
jgi:hypothetical protein